MIGSLSNKKGLIPYLPFIALWFVGFVFPLFAGDGGVYRSATLVVAFFSIGVGWFYKSKLDINVLKSISLLVVALAFPHFFWADSLKVIEDVFKYYIVILGICIALLLAADMKLSSYRRILWLVFVVQISLLLVEVLKADNPVETFLWVRTTINNINPLFVAAQIGFIAVLLSVQAASDKERLAVCVLALLACYVAKSRGPLLFYLLVMILWYFERMQARETVLKMKNLIIFVCCPLIVVVGLYCFGYLDKVYHDHLLRPSLRLEIWAEVINQLKGHYLFGLGPHETIAIEGFEISHPHNFLLAVLYKGGFATLLLVCVVLVKIGVVKEIVRGRESIKYAAIFVILAMLTNGNYPLHRVNPDFPLIWISLVGLILMAGKRKALGANGDH
ncbi:O-antigen ligase family protein [Aestuariirhabdus sp. Z084]|uniref:O-antigen ligase family protein n=1 Tax=Aestuariirhabdus haliotis TaxID=2918751 RepID=UPI00201B4656|nr:O-antigen ligase family protein [Aestuariirhabdus haliotis]MCL6415595.1 O-antigen ligase family protein [Aestuariirhabdus haliotis]MCL6419590.1 O-antigen ligase family protein [Aestuariirhabdus haliotis]